MQLSVIIVSYNVRTFLENALNSIQKAMQNITGEVFVVDNASDDGSVEMVQKIFPFVNIIANKSNIGFAAANNIALKKASGNYIAIINPDTVVQEDTFTSLIGFLDGNPTIGLAGCKILNSDGSLQLACRRSIPTPWSAFTKTIGLSHIFPKTKLFGKYNLTYLDPDKTYEVEAVSGSFMFLRKTVYDQVGGLDETFFMYGEDLDWCYRILRSGWKIFYFSKTQIIHYKGESTKQSNIDDIKTFYDAMHIFVKKHLNHSLLILFFLRLGIFFRSMLAWAFKLTKNSILPISDWLIIIISLGIGFYLRTNVFFFFPDYALLPIFIIPGGVITVIIHILGGYSKYKYSISSTVVAVIAGYTIITSLTFFFKEFAFSRIAIIYSAVISLIILSVFRIFIKYMLRYGIFRSNSILGKNTFIVGITDTSPQLLQKLRIRVNDRYNVVGFIDITRKRIGDKISGIEIIGSVNNIRKLITEYNVSEVIFSTDSLSFKEILSIIGRSQTRDVNFRMVPNSLEVIIGKTHIDHLNDLPLIDIEYKLNLKFNQFIKRIFDQITAFILIIIFFPTTRAFKKKFHYNLLKNVLTGKYSLVGSPIGTMYENNILKPGLMGLAQLNNSDNLNREEIEKYDLFYAKNYSPILDAEIVIKSIILSIKKR